MAHASLSVVLKDLEISERRKKYARVEGSMPLDMADWCFNSAFTKVVLSCDSEQELIDLHNKAKAAKLPTSLITDAGHTVFHGVPTKTTCSVGPADEVEIDKITGHLKLL